MLRLSPLESVHSDTLSGCPQFPPGIEMHGEHEPPAAMEIIKALAASMHVAASIPNFLAHEVPALQAVQGGPANVQRSPMGKSYIKKPFVMTEGNIDLKGNLDGPGLGIDSMITSSITSAAFRNESSRKCGMPLTAWCATIDGDALTNWSVNTQR